ncbi:3-deoxy-D-manno-octulosonic acid kinase [Motiliproteus sp. SC1-56]|uniref:3-deoxy-D-manno-octulosonic acid kinase n=1 Tax=Motiliproteus sp. SC1-56 TaxID=2799565 RepID=UPI001A8E35C2|nr:3-deoxy-D-manno-octulosonic acid kinase [Motiliproteus sp. SC1-56]
MTFQILQQSGGTVLAVPELVEHITPSWFDLNWWQARGQSVRSAPGRGESYFLDYEGWPLVWRHYKRGGLVARLSEDRYLWPGLTRTRAYREFTLTEQLRQRGLPVPRPLLARVQRCGLSYRADLFTQRLPAVRSMADALASGAEQVPWDEVGRTLARFHREGLDHVDLNLRNILIDAQGRVFVIDFDRCRLRQPAVSWQQGNLRRLRRSLHKLFPGAELDAEWQRLLAAYDRG